jgi:threonine dehydrogenase-like Zn-dependent dehydrogenase
VKAFSIKDLKVIGPAELEEPKMGPSDVLIEINYIGLCGSDLNAYRGLMPFVKFPRVPGHEISGVIVDKGSDVPNTISIADKVTVSPYTNCGVCPSCRAGRPNCCEFNKTLGVQRDGALTKFISVPFEKVFVSKTLSLIELALVEPLSVGYHGANRGQVCEIDTVLLLGCGTIGMGALLAAVRKGATIIALDIDDAKLEQAKKFGATYTINASKEDALAAIKKLTNNEGASIAIEAAGTQTTYKLALDAVCFSGRIVFIGYPKQEVSLMAPLMVSKEVNIYGSRNALRVFPSVINMFERKEKPYTDLVTKIFPFEQTAEAFDYWDKNTGTVSKILIDIKN